jgi:sortase (surface protein transpeptidase)
MLKNNSVIKNQFYANPGHGSKRGSILLVKLIFVLMILAGIGIATSGAIKQFSNSNAPLVDDLNNLPQAQAASFTSLPNPSLITIPSLQISAPFEDLGLNSDHTIEVPKNNMGVGWFIYGAKPGQLGSFVVVGHFDSLKGPAIFTKLKKIKSGDKILITRDDGTVITYQADTISQFSQNNFPTKAIYGSVPYAGIRLITCSGVWDKQAGHYSQNLVVFGKEINE